MQIKLNNFSLANIKSSIAEDRYKPSVIFQLSIIVNNITVCLPLKTFSSTITKFNLSDITIQSLIIENPKFDSLSTNSFSTQLRLRCNEVTYKNNLVLT